MGGGNESTGSESSTAAPLVVLTGPPGAGKSTVGRLLALEFDPSALLEGDAFFGFLARGVIDPWRPESNDQNEVVIDASGAAAGRYAAGGITTVFEGMIGPWFLPRFLAASGLGSLQYIVLLPSAEVCVDRVSGRTGHTFRDEQATRLMHDQFSRAYGVDLDPRHVLDDNAAGPAELAVRVREGVEAGRFVYSGPEGPVPTPPVLPQEVIQLTSPRSESSR